MISTRSAYVTSAGLLATFLLSSCRPSEDDGSKNVAEIAGAGLDLAVEREISAREWGWIRDLRIVQDSLLVVLDKYGPPFLTLIHLSSGSILATFGNAGDGPGELRDPTVLVSGRGPDPHVWVYEGNARQLSRYDLAPSVAYRNSVRFRRSLLVTDPFWTDDGLLAGGVFFNEHLLLFADSQLTDTPTYVGQVPYSASEVPGQALMYANGYLIDVAPDGSRAALAFKYAPELRVVDVPARRVQERIPTPQPVGAPRTLTGGGTTMFALQVSEVAFYVDVSASEPGVWAVYCGCKGSTVIGSDAPGARVVQFYDWRTGFRGEYDVRRSISALAASTDGRRLYVAVFDPQPMILELAWRTEAGESM